MLMTDPNHLTDDDLIARIASLGGAERWATGTLVGHLCELEARKLHLAHGFRSIFGYCRHVLHFSEHESYDRMEAVHAARRFPVILALLVLWYASGHVRRLRRAGPEGPGPAPARRTR